MIELATALRHARRAGQLRANQHGWHDISSAPKKGQFTAYAPLWGAQTVTRAEHRSGLIITTLDAEEFFGATHWRPLGLDPFGKEFPDD